MEKKTKRSLFPFFQLGILFIFSIIFPVKMREIAFQIEGFLLFRIRSFQIITFFTWNNLQKSGNIPVWIPKRVMYFSLFYFLLLKKLHKICFKIWVIRERFYLFDSFGNLFDKPSFLFHKHSFFFYKTQRNKRDCSTLFFWGLFSYF